MGVGGGGGWGVGKDLLSSQKEVGAGEQVLSGKKRGGKQFWHNF